MSNLKDLMATMEDTGDFNTATALFLSARKELIDTFIEKKDSRALALLLEEDRNNLACLQEKITESKKHIANINKIGGYLGRFN